MSRRWLLGWCARIASVKAPHATHSIELRAASAFAPLRLLRCVPRNKRLLALQSTFWIDHVPTGKTIDAANYAASSFGASVRTLARLPSTSSPTPQKTPSYRPPSIRWAGSFITSQSPLVRSSSRESSLDSAAAKCDRNSSEACRDSAAAGSGRKLTGTAGESCLEPAAAGCCRTAESFRSRCSCMDGVHVGHAAGGALVQHAEALARGNLEDRKETEKGSKERGGRKCVCQWERDVAAASRLFARAGGCAAWPVMPCRVVLWTCCCSSATQPVMCTDPAAPWRCRCTTAANGGWLPGPVEEPVAESSEALPDQDWS